MRYIELKKLKLYGNSSWRQRRYMEVRKGRSMYEDMNQLRKQT